MEKNKQLNKQEDECTHNYMCRGAMLVFWTLAA